MWVSAEYTATTLFSLRLSTATSSGARTHLVPTPFAIKMALLDVVCRVDGVNAGRDAWDWLRPAAVALRPSKRVIVNNTFIKVLRPRRNPAEPGSSDEGFFGRTIAYREFAFLDGAFGIALEVETTEAAQLIARWMTGINYLGKRGSFIQITAEPQISDILPERYLVVDGNPRPFSLDALLMSLDDTGDALTFDRVNIYSQERIQLGKHRIFRQTALPYRVMRSSRGYTEYQLMDEEQSE